MVEKNRHSDSRAHNMVMTSNLDGCYKIVTLGDHAAAIGSTEMIQKTQ